MRYYIEGKTTISQNNIFCLMLYGRDNNQLGNRYIQDLHNQRKNEKTIFSLKEARRMFRKQNI